MKKCLHFCIVILILKGATAYPNSWTQYGNGYNSQQNNGIKDSYSSYSPRLQIDRITAEWVCNNLGTGETKFFGFHGVVKTNIPAKDIERFVNQGPETSVQNQPSKNGQGFTSTQQLYQSPTIPKDPETAQSSFTDDRSLLNTQTPNVDGEGIIDIRFGK